MTKLWLLVIIPAILVFSGCATRPEVKDIGDRTADSGFQKEDGNSVADTDITAIVPASDLGTKMGLFNKRWTEGWFGTINASSSVIESLTINTKVNSPLIVADGTNTTTLASRYLIVQQGATDNLGKFYVSNTGATYTSSSLQLAGTLTGITTALTGTANNALAISVPNQPAANSAGVGLSITADAAGSGGTGNNAGGILDLIGGAKAGTGNSGFVRIGTGNPLNISIFSPQSLWIQGYLEVNNSARFNSSVAFQSGTTQADSGQALWGNGNDVVIVYSVAQTPDSWLFGTSADSNGFVVIEKADVATDFALAVQTNPTVFVGSADASNDKTDFAYITQNQTGAIFGQWSEGATATAGKPAYLLGANGGSGTTGGAGGAGIVKAGYALGSGNNIGGNIDLDVGGGTGTSATGTIRFYEHNTTFSQQIGGIAKNSITLTPMIYGMGTDDIGATGLILGSYNPFNNLTSKLLSIQSGLSGFSFEHFAVSTSTLMYNSQSSTSTLNITTVAANKGTCFVVQNIVGVPKYMYISAADAWVISDKDCRI